MKKEIILFKIQQKKEALSTLGVEEIGLFGSYARGDEKINSDIDILITFKSGEEKYDNLLAVYDILENLFPGKKIEVVTRTGLSPYMGPKILKQVMYA